MFVLYKFVQEKGLCQKPGHFLTKTRPEKKIFSYINWLKINIINKFWNIILIFYRHLAISLFLFQIWFSSFLASIMIPFHLSAATNNWIPILRFIALMCEQPFTSGHKHFSGIYFLLHTSFFSLKTLKTWDYVNLIIIYHQLSIEIIRWKNIGRSSA